MTAGSTSTPEEAADYLRSYHPGHAELALWVRQVLLDAEPDLEQRVYRGWQAVGFHDPDAGYVCGLFPRPEGLLLTFEHGASLPDPDGALIGDGRQVRSLPVHAADAGTEARIRGLLEQAISYGLALRAGGLPPS
jgi:hypothetical protein